MQFNYYQVRQSFKASVIYHFNAPYSLGEYTNLPENLIIRLDPEPVESASALYAWPYNEHQWETVFAPGYLGRRHYAGYSLVVNKQDIAKNCKKIDIFSIKNGQVNTNQFNTNGTDPESIIDTTPFSGCLLGTAVGDAIGLPFEGLSKQRIESLITFPLDHQFLMGKGMVSDDTEHSYMVAQALTNSQDSHEFCHHLSWKLRFWLLSFPAGIGHATLVSIMKLLMGYSAQSSGVDSAGNGPMMRSAIIGVYAGEDEEYLRHLVRLSSRITHTDPRAEYSAQIVARAAWISSQGNVLTPQELATELLPWTQQDSELKDWIDNLVQSLEHEQDTETFCQIHAMESGVPGYCYTTLVVVLHIWMRFPHNYLQAIHSAVKCGGDTDTVAAIVGGIVGAHVGKAGIPQAWLENICEWPMTVDTLDDIGIELAFSKATSIKRKPIKAFYPLLVLRNLLFLLVVLGHGLRRFFPPY